MRTFLICACLLVLLVAVTSGKQLPREKRESTDVVERKKRDLGDYKPQNIAIVITAVTVTLECSSNGDPGARIQWIEFVYTNQGGIISENEFIFVTGPMGNRVTVITDSSTTFHLQINPLMIDDAGQYQCIDGQNNIDYMFLQLTVIHSSSSGSGWNCSSTIRDSGTVIEDTYVTNDCTVGYSGGLIPNLTWTGPFDFVQGYAPTPNAIWSGMHFNATRSMQTNANRANLYFTDYFLPVAGNAATNVPTYTDFYQGKQMYIYWGPKNIAADLIKDNYELDDVLTCSVDANPVASLQWQNLRTLEVTSRAQFTITAALVGTNQTMRCQAINTIEGIQFTANLFINVNVPAPTDPPTTIPTTTTTPPPAVSPCTDLTGQWVATVPSLVTLCISLDLTNNGFLTGFMKNGTQTFSLDLVGRSQANDFSEIGFNGIWPAEIGLSSGVGECHRCYGVETLIVNYISRQKGSPCGVAGPIQFSDEFRFSRVPPTVACPNLPAAPAA